MDKEEKKAIGQSVILTEGMELGKVFAESGVFPDIKSAAQGCIKVLAGKELGLSPIQSLQSFYFVGGRLGIGAQTLGALVKKSGKYDYRIIAHDNESCQIVFYKLVDGNEEKIGESLFDLKAAAKAGIVNGANWKNYPMNMLFARALTNGIRWFCPDAVSAFAYSVEELQDLEVPKKLTTVTMDENLEVTNGSEEKKA